MWLFLFPNLPALHGNGGKGNGYWWTQTLSEVNVFCPIPRGIKGKQIDCEIKKDHLKFGIKGEKPVIDASLHKEVKPDDCYWTIGKPKKNLASIELC